MTYTIPCPPRLDIEQKKFSRLFDREPFGFSHNLGDIDLLKLDSLHTLAQRFIGHPADFMVAEGATAPETTFFSTPFSSYKPHEAIERLSTGGYRILLKRAENHDPRYRELLETLFKQIVDLRGGLGREKVVRLESGIFITSAATITPFHFDPEINFFSQIEGQKIYHVYSPSVLSEAELESFYIRGMVSIGQVDLTGRDSAREHIFTLRPGEGFHQPQNSPHWVETGEALSISFAFVFETDATRALGRTRAFNHYLRRLHCTPLTVGLRPSIDLLKADFMKAGVMQARSGIGKILRRTKLR